jgi:hypothetical protein
MKTRVFSYIVLKLQVKVHVGEGSMGKIHDCAFIPVIQYKCDHLIINQSDGLVKESVNIKCIHIFVFSTYMITLLFLICGTYFYECGTTSVTPSFQGNISRVGSQGNISKVGFKAQNANNTYSYMNIQNAKESSISYR